MGGFGWIDRLVVVAGRVCVAGVRWGLRHPLGTAAVGFVVVAVAR
jgi:hypothetical protein